MSDQKFKASASKLFEVSARSYGNSTSKKQSMKRSHPVSESTITHPFAISTIRKSRINTTSKKHSMKVPRLINQSFAFSEIGHQLGNKTAAKFSQIGVGKLESPVIKICRINHKDFNCKRIFNLFSCYGTVLKVKFLLSTKDACWIEMKSGDQMSTAYKYLNHFKAFGSDLNLKHNSASLSSIFEPKKDFPLSSDHRSFVDFSNSNLSKRIVRESPSYPSQKLRFSGLPIEFTNDQIQKLFAEVSENGPLPIAIFREKSLDGYSLSGSMTFDNTERATEAIMLYNFTQLSNSCFLNLHYSES